jgi:hypothetical protein
VTVTEARTAAAALLAELPQPIHDALERVALHVVDRPPAEVPSDVKGIFVGRQRVGGPLEADDDNDDADAGEWFDVGPSGDLELVGVGGGSPAEGAIYLVAPNLADADDLQLTALHEITHALGDDEQGADDLGLG